MERCCSTEQARRFFASLCFANQSLSTFEKVLCEIPEHEWPIVFLSSIILENCGLSKLKPGIMAAALSSACIGEVPNECLQVEHTTSNTNAENEKSQTRKNMELWVAIPNQYIMQDRAWLHPVIRACDPDRATFKEEDYGIQLVEQLCEDLSIPLRNREISSKEVIEVELSHIVDVMIFILAHPTSMGVTVEETESLIKLVLENDAFGVLRARAITCYGYRSETRQANGELSKGLLLLTVLTMSFVATGFMVGFYYVPEDMRRIYLTGAE